MASANMKAAACQAHRAQALSRAIRHRTMPDIFDQIHKTPDASDPDITGEMSHAGTPKLCGRCVLRDLRGYWFYGHRCVGGGRSAAGDDTRRLPKNPVAE